MHDMERRFLWIGVAVIMLTLALCVALVVFGEPSGDGDLILIPTGDGTIVPIWFPASQP